VVGSIARSILVAALALPLASCQIFKRPLEEPDPGQAAVLLVSTEMPQPISDIARHAWLAVRDKNGTRWQRIEVGGFGAGPFNGVGDIVLHELWVGDEAERAIPCLREHAPRFRPGRSYLPWPGPNSNTFVAELLRACKLRADLPTTSIGKDHDGLIGVAFTTGGTGVQLETPLVGFRLGLTEGIELRFLGLGFGIDLWPPAILVPFGSGRIGFADRR
jgi:hypothetical protein